MPAVSEAQYKFMQAVKNNPKFRKKVGVSKSVGEDFISATSKKLASKLMNSK